MSDNIDSEVMDHDYDGIKECNNPLPKWWLGTFYITIIFAIGYYFHYEMNNGPTLADELKVEMAQLNEVRQANAPKVGNETEEEILQFGTPENLKAGAEIFIGKCAACHGNDLQGIIGPNLTDDYWINGGKKTDMVKIIRTGVADKGMPPWIELLKKEEIFSVVNFIVSKRGSNPAGAKAPQGELVQ